VSDTKMTLAPCPFCGGPAIRATERDDRPQGSALVGCPKRYCAGAMTWYTVDAWNRRAPTSTPTLTTLKARLDYYLQGYRINVLPVAYDPDLIRDALVAIEELERFAFSVQHSDAPSCLARFTRDEASFLRHLLTQEEFAGHTPNVHRLRAMLEGKAVEPTVADGTKGMERGR